MILAACWGIAFLGAEESSPPDSLRKANGTNLGGDLQQIMQEQKGLSRIYPLLFKEEDAGIHISEMIENLERYRNKRIVKINVMPRDVFSTPKVGRFSKIAGDLVNLGNYVHPKTRERLIRRQLFFTEGDSLNPEYLISNLQYLYDQILFSEIEFEIVDIDNDEVEINVFTREKFFLKFGGKYNSKDDYSIHIGNKNLFGTGHSWENIWYVAPENKGTIGWESYFANPSIVGSFFQGDVHWIDMPGHKLFEYHIQRPFIYPIFRYSGGSDFAQSSIYPPQDSVSVKKTEAGAWIARNFYPFDYPRYAYTALSINQDWYHLRPSSDAETGMPWQKSLFVLGALGLTQSSYRYMPRVSSFLDNDYLPEGYLFELYGGADLGEYKNRPFAGLYGSFSIFPSQDQYIYIKSALEGFWAEGKVEEGVFALEPGYISQTTDLGKIKARSLVTARYIRSRKILETQSLSLKSNLFYRGKRDLGGTDLFYVSFEEDLALPISLFGFQLTTFGFADLAIMEDNRRETDKKFSLFAQGIGLRLRNPSLIWDFIEVCFSMDQSVKTHPGYNLSLRFKSAVSLKGFKGKRPQRYDFQ